MSPRGQSPREKNVMGAACIVAGVLLVMWGRNVAYSLPGQVQYLFTGSPGEKATALFIAGGALILIGMYQVFWSR
jgi:type II secretory pathway component PulM